MKNYLIYKLCKVYSVDSNVCIGLQLAAGILLVVSTSMCTRRADAYGGTAYKYCLNRCNFFLFLCIRESCPGRKWPLPVPDECVEERTQCIVEECAKFSRSYG